MTPSNAKSQLRTPLITERYSKYHFREQITEKCPFFLMTTPNWNGLPETFTVSRHSETHDYDVFRAYFAGRCSAFSLLCTWVAFYFNHCLAVFEMSKVVTGSEILLAGELCFLWVVLFHKLI